MNMKRMRGRNHRGGNGGGGGGGIRHNTGNIPLNRNHVFDSNGPDIRVRGTAQQLFEKYLQLGRDATSSGDRVMAEGYFQHAEHYFRIINAMNQAAQQSQAQAGQGAGGGHPSQHNPRRGYTNEDGQANGPAPNGFEGEEQEQPGEVPVGLGDQPQTARDIPIAAVAPSES